MTGNSQTFSERSTIHDPRSASFRVGIGYDIHRLVPSRPLMLGGVLIPCDQGLLGHSDGDALLHAIADALLGAAALGDIGRHFPDTDPAFAGADSAVLLTRVCELLARKGFEVVNVDANVIAEQPKLAPHIEKMRARIAEVVRLSLDAVSIKARTNEGLDAVGRGEAIAVHAVVLIEKAYSKSSESSESGETRSNKT
jgi:2-C-methyl-D-erythritol 2,4-cyclodiphosphate synthase